MPFELRPVISLACLNLDELGDQFPPAAVEAIGHCLPLRFKPEPAAALPIRADPQIADEFPGSHSAIASIVKLLHERGAFVLSARLAAL
jgi:hypothetical protein